MITNGMKNLVASVFAVTVAFTLVGCGASDSPAPVTYQQDTTVIEVDSSIFTSVGYNAEAQELTVVFRDSGDVYVYQNVPQDTFDALMAADSLGSFFHANIREAFEFERN